MSDNETRIPDTVYGHPGHWTAHDHRATFVCDNGMVLSFVMPPGNVAKAGPLDEVARDLDTALRNAGDIGGAL